MHALQWAEIVPVSPQFGGDQDFQHRQRGRLALRPLTRSDLSVLRSNGGSGSVGSGAGLRCGTRVAVIDLRVFVPEVISVLSTCSAPELLEHLKGIPFMKQVRGSNVSEAVSLILISLSVPSSPYLFSTHA